MVQDGGVRIIFVGEQEQYDKAHRIFALCPTLERIVVFDPSVRISTHDPNALYFSDFIKLGEDLPRQPEVEKPVERGLDGRSLQYPLHQWHSG